MQAAAAQLQALEIQADWVLDQSFPQTAQGIYLDHHGVMRGLERTPAEKATGTLRFLASSAPAVDVAIPAGSVCMTEDEARFQTTAAVTLKAGEQFVEAPAEAVDSGTGGNVIGGAVCILAACPVAVTGCTNPEPFSGGREQESDEAFRERILESYRRLPNGANAVWYEQTALGYPGVAAAKAVGRARGIGTVDVYVAAEGGLPTEELLEGLQAQLQEKREIAVDVQVKAPTAKTVEIEVEILPTEGTAFEEVCAEVEETMRAFFTGKLLGQSLTLAELGSRIYQLEHVANYHLISPVEDLAADDTVLPVLGGLTVTEMEA